MEGKNPVTLGIDESTSLTRIHSYTRLSKNYFDFEEEIVDETVQNEQNANEQLPDRDCSLRRPIQPRQSEFPHPDRNKNEREDVIETVEIHRSIEVAVADLSHPLEEGLVTRVEASTERREIDIHLVDGFRKRLIGERLELVQSLEIGIIECDRLR